MSVYILSDIMYRILIRFYFLLLIFSVYRLLVKVKHSRYRPGVAQRVPGS